MESTKNSPTSEVCAQGIVPSMFGTRVMKTAHYGYYRLAKIINHLDRYFFSIFCDFLIFAIESVPSKSLESSPFEMAYGHSVRGLLEVTKEQ